MSGPEMPRNNGEKPLLALDRVTMMFGGLAAIADLSMEVFAGELHTIIGPNGSGKTTVLNLISGFYKPTKGRIYFDGSYIENISTSDRVAMGIARTFQNSRLFPNMTALENVMVGMHSRTESGLVSILNRSSAMRAEEKRIREKALELLETMGLAELADIQCREIAYGLRRILEIARALASGPKIILLDEPMAGLNPVEKDNLVHLIRKINDNGTAVVIIEHDIRVIMTLSKHITVLNFGGKIAEGDPIKIQNDEKVINAYLGSGVNNAYLGSDVNNA